jgi:competence protein ComEC
LTPLATSLECTLPNRDGQMEKYSLSAHLQALSNRPALAGAFSVSAITACAQYPWLCAGILPLWAVLVLNLATFARRACLVIALAGLIVHFFHLPEPLLADSRLPETGKALVLETQPRPTGHALIAQTSFGKVRLSWKKHPVPLPGDSIAWQVRWMPANPPTVPGAFDAPKWQRSQGLVAMGSAQTLRIISSHFHWQRPFSYFRAALRRRLERAFAPAETGLLMGLLAGDRSGISDTLQNDFQRTGLVHVLAISGFHIVLLAGMLNLFLRSLRLPHSVVRIIAMLLLTLYAPATGGSAAVWRAVFMFLVIESGPLFELKADALNSLGVAVVVLLLWDPAQLAQAGFQLSVAATGGILLGQHLPWKPTAKHRRTWKYMLYKAIVEPSWVTLCATAATLPLLVHHFQSFSPVAWLGNLVVVPLVGLGMEAGCLSLLMPAWSFLYQPFADSATLLLRLASIATRALADGPGASATLGPWPLPCLCASLILLANLPAWRNPNPWGRRMILAATLVCAGCYTGLGLWARLYPSWTLTLIDVGQGDAILLKSPGGRHYLIDTGPPQKNRSLVRDRLLPLLRQRGIQRLEALAITHPDADHFGNAAELLQQFPVDELWIPPCARWEEKPTWQHVLETAALLYIPVRDLNRGLVLYEQPRWQKSPPWSLTVVHPDSLACADDVNTGSLVLRIAGQGGSALLTGDLTIAGENELLGYALPSDILKLGHHGSKTSSSRPFLQNVNPQTGWISAGQGNRFHHPHPQVIQRLDSLGIDYDATMDAGSLEARFSEQGYTLWHYQGEWTATR